jgi:hypothetical protein
MPMLSKPCWEGTLPKRCITPHAGEFKIFFGEAVKESIRERVKQVIDAAKKV